MRTYEIHGPQIGVPETCKARSVVVKVYRLKHPTTASGFVYAVSYHTPEGRKGFDLPDNAFRHSFIPAKPVWDPMYGLLPRTTTCSLGGTSLGPAQAFRGRKLIRQAQYNSPYMVIKATLLAIHRI